MKSAIAAEVAKSSPAVGITGWAWMNDVTITDGVGWATMAYIVLQALYLLWKWWREWKRGG